MALTKILQGSNRIINRPLKQSDGTALPAANILTGKVDLVQNGVVKATINFAASPSELRAGADANSLDLELTAARTTALAKAPLTERYYLEITANVHVADAQRAKLKVEFTELEIA